MSLKRRIGPSLSRPIKESGSKAPLECRGPGSAGFSQIFAIEVRDKEEQSRPEIPTTERAGAAQPIVRSGRGVCDQGSDKGKRPLSGKRSGIVVHCALWGRIRTGVAKQQLQQVVNEGAEGAVRGFAQQGRMRSNSEQRGPVRILDKADDLWFPTRIGKLRLVSE